MYESGRFFAIEEVKELLCKRCNEVKNLSEFDRVFFNKRGYDVYCHDCRIEIDQIKNSITEKRCRQCNRVKPISEFDRNASCRDGYSKECIECLDETNQRRRARNNSDSWDRKTYVCRMCGLQKPSYEFTSGIYYDGKNKYCRSCIAAMNRRKVLRFERDIELNGYPLNKRCKECGHLLPLDHFHLDRRKKDGLADKCIECNSERHKKWIENKETRGTDKKKKFKECQICHELKPLHLFTKSKITADGYGSKCKICRKKEREENIQIWTRQRSEKKVKLKELKCRICGRVLPISSFSKNRENKSGYYYHCKDCHKKIEKDIEKKWKKDREKSNFEFSFDVKLEKKCNICGKVLPISNFWKRKASKDGYSHYCKDCFSKKSKARKKRLKERGFPEELLPDEKLCGNCGRVLPRDLFRRDSTTSDGLDTRCKECRNEYYREYSSRPEVKQKKWEYKHQPEVMEKARKRARRYSQKPEVKVRQREYKREYIKRPYVKKKRMEYDKEYRKRPEIKEKRRKYDARPEVRKRKAEFTKRWQMRKKQEKLLAKD